MCDKINLAEKFPNHEYWKLYVAGELKGELAKLDKLKGEFAWHLAKTNEIRGRAALQGRVTATS